MLAQLIDAFQSHHDPARLRSVIRKQSLLIDRLRLENATLRAENRQMRRRLADAELRLLQRAEADALLLGGLYFAGLPTSRRACADVGIGARRWRRAIALLMVGRAHDGQRVTVIDAPDYERAI